MVQTRRKRAAEIEDKKELQKSESLTPTKRGRRKTFPVESNTDDSNKCTSNIDVAEEIKGEIHEEIKDFLQKKPEIGKFRMVIGRKKNNRMNKNEADVFLNQEEEEEHDDSRDIKKTKFSKMTKLPNDDTLNKIDSIPIAKKVKAEDIEPIVEKRCSNDEEIEQLDHVQKKTDLGSLKNNRTIHVTHIKHSSEYKFLTVNTEVDDEDELVVEMVEETEDEVEAPTNESSDRKESPENMDIADSDSDGEKNKNDVAVEVSQSETSINLKSSEIMTADQYQTELSSPTPSISAPIAQPSSSHFLPHFLHPARAAFASQQPQISPHSVLPSTEDTSCIQSSSMGFKPMAIKKGSGRIGSSHNPLLTSPGRRSTNFGSSSSNMPPPAMVEIPKLSFFNPPTPQVSSNSLFHSNAPSTSGSNETKLTDDALKELREKATRAAENVARRVEEEQRLKEEESEKERRRERRHRRIEEDKLEITRKQRDEEDRRRGKEENHDQQRKEDDEKTRLDQKTIEDVAKQKTIINMSVPQYELINECRYLTKNSSKKKTASMICECHRTGSNCSDDSCVNRSMYFECPSSCPVAKCKNQRFSKKKYASVEAYHTGTAKGCGLKALKDIKSGQFIIEYVGEVLEREDYEKRKQKYALNKAHKHHYLCDTGSFTIDATTMGNPSRFINHSCEPNAECVKWSVPKTPGDVSRIGFFAKKFISAGEEITFDYQFVNYGREAQPCYCETESCIGWIGERPDEDDNSDNEEIVTTGNNDIDPADEQLIELTELSGTERKNSINRILADLVFKNKKHVKRIISVAAIMTDPGQKEKLLEDIFTSNMSIGMQAYYAKNGFAERMFYWLAQDEMTIEHLKLRQKILQILHLDIFLPCVKGLNVLIELVSRLSQTNPPELSDVKSKIEQMVEGATDEDDHETRCLQVYQEIVHNCIRIKEMAVRLHNHWFNRSVNFKIPKKVREPDIKEEIIEKDDQPYDQQQNRELSPIRGNWNEGRDYRPRFFNNGNDVHQYRFGGYHGNNYKEDFGFTRSRNGGYYDGSSNRDYNRKRFFRSRSRSRSRSRTPPKRRRYEDREYYRRSPDRNKHSPVDKLTPETADEKNLHSSRSTSSNKMQIVSAPCSNQPSSSAALKKTLLQTPSQITPAANVPASSSGIQQSVPMYSYEYGIYEPHIQMVAYQQYIAALQQHQNGSGDSKPLSYWPPHGNASEYTMETIPSLSFLQPIYEKATADQLRSRLEALHNETHKIHQLLAKREAMDLVAAEAAATAAAAAAVAAEEKRKQTEAAEAAEKSKKLAESEKYVWGRATAETGETYYYHKQTRAVQWDLPLPEQGEVEPEAVQDNNLHSESSEQSAEKSHSLSVRVDELIELSLETSDDVTTKKRAQDEKEARINDVDEKLIYERKSKVFRTALERIISPLVKSLLKNTPDATQEKLVWLTKLVVKEMFKREKAQKGFDFRISEKTENMVRNYAKALIERKLANGDIWKGFSFC